MSDLHRQVVMITGAAGNLGRAAAGVFARHGAQLVLLDLHRETLDAAYPGTDSDRLLQAVDLTDGTAVKLVVEAAIARFQKIDVLCNIAGGFHYGEPFHAMGADVLRRMLDLNVTTLLNAVAAVVPPMIDAGSGTIINIGAAGHVQGHAHMSAYAVAKSGVMRITESMAEELKDKGISIFCLMPTIIDTPQNRQEMANADFTTWISPVDIAELMVLLTSASASLMSGCLIPLK